jgi:hypothetical protein
MKVLLSWSGTRSKELALALYHWIPGVIQSIEPWMSESDIDIGSRWGPDLDRELEQTDFGILCLTPECKSSTWIHYEAGALSKLVDKSRVCPYLLGLQPTDLIGPLVNFQAAKANREETLKLMQTINNIAGDKPLPSDRLKSTFERFWPDLEAEINKIAQHDSNIKKYSRTSPDMVEETLRIVRDMAKTILEIQNQLVAFEGKPIASKIKCAMPKGWCMRKISSRLGEFKIYYVPKDIDDDEKMAEIIKKFKGELDKNQNIKFDKKCCDLLENTAKKSGFQGRIMRIVE